MSPFAGTYAVTQSDGYTYTLAWTTSTDGPSVSIANDAPGRATVDFSFTWTLTLTNTTPGRNLPTRGNTYAVYAARANGQGGVSLSGLGELNWNSDFNEPGSATVSPGASVSGTRTSNIGRRGVLESEVDSWKTALSQPDWWVLIRSSNYLHGGGGSSIVDAPCQGENDNGYEALLAWAPGRPDPAISVDQLCASFQVDDLIS